LYILACVRQGGILSPLLFAVYIDGLVAQLEASGFGCKLHGLYVGSILYADNIILLAHTSYALQKMLDICNSEITALDLHSNVVKSVVMRVGSRWNSYCAEFYLGSSGLKFVDNIKYLGIYMKAGSKFSRCYEHLQEALLSQRDRATRLSVEILQLQNIAIVWHYWRDPSFSIFTQY